MAALAGRTIGITAERRWEEQADLFRRRGAGVVHGPTMTTVDLTAEPTLKRVTNALVELPPEWLVVTTGAGFRLWRDTARAWGCDEALVEALARRATRVVCRGAKAASAVRAAGLDVHWRAAHESMEEVVAYLADHATAGATVAVQLFDPDDHWSTAALRGRHPSLLEVPVYQWRLPEDVAPAEHLVEQVAAGAVDAVTFTSQPAVRFLFAIADRPGQPGADRLRTAFAASVLPVCVGPVCAEALVERGVDRALYPDPPRLVPMVKLVEERLGVVTR